MKSFLQTQEQFLTQNKEFIKDEAVAPDCRSKLQMQLAVPTFDGYTY